MKIICRGSKVESREPPRVARIFFHPRSSTLDPRPLHRRAFTLIEIMVVVAIIGLVAAMGLPSIIMALQKEGMRRAVSDLEDVCFEARRDAIFNNRTTAVVFHPKDRRFEVEGVTDSGSGSTANPSSGKTTSATLPDGVELAMLDINLQDYGASEWAKVRFFPNGTSDEMTVVLHSRDEFRKITLEFSTGLPTVTDVDK